MVEVYKTFVIEEDDSNRIIQILLEHFPNYKINFDLEDCDRMLRIEGLQMESKVIKEVLIFLGLNANQ